MIKVRESGESAQWYPDQQKSAVTRWCKYFKFSSWLEWWWGLRGWRCRAPASSPSSTAVALTLRETLSHSGRARTSDTSQGQDYNGLVSAVSRWTAAQDCTGRGTLTAPRLAWCLGWWRWSEASSVESLTSSISECRTQALISGQDAASLHFMFSIYLFKMFSWSTMIVP